MRHRESQVVPQWRKIVTRSGGIGRSTILILAEVLFYPGKGQQKAFVDRSDPGKELHDNYWSRIANCAGGADLAYMCALTHRYYNRDTMYAEGGG